MTTHALRLPMLRLNVARLLGQPVRSTLTSAADRAPLPDEAVESRDASADEMWGRRGDGSVPPMF